MKHILTQTELDALCPRVELNRAQAELDRARKIIESLRRRLAQCKPESFFWRSIAGYKGHVRRQKAELAELRSLLTEARED